MTGDQATQAASEPGAGDALRREGQTSAVVYEGVTRSKMVQRGGMCGGVAPAAFVKEKFDRRWLSLIVKRGGEIVGGIEPHPDTGRRVWWAAP